MRTNIIRSHDNLVPVGHFMTIDAVRLCIAVACTVQFNALDSLFESFEQDVGHHPILVLDLILSKLHYHKGLGGDFFRKQEASKTVNVLKMLPALKEGVELATDHRPGSVAWYAKSVNEDIEMILEKTELDARHNRHVRTMLCFAF